MAIERTPSGTMKWVKVLSPLANNVVGRCARLDPIVFEFPEMTGHGRRDFWLALIKESIGVHKFSRTYKLEGLGMSGALARAVLGIERMRAVREVFKVLPLGADCLLTFCYGDIMLHGDLVMAALADTLRHSGHGEGGNTSLTAMKGIKYLLALQLRL